MFGLLVKSDGPPQVKDIIALFVYGDAAHTFKADHYKNNDAAVYVAEVEVPELDIITRQRLPLL